MKLNLLPTKVKQEGALTGAWITFGVLTLIGVVVAVLMIVKSNGDLSDASGHLADQMQRANTADTTSKQADAIMQSQNVGLLTRNISLANSMQAHCSVYPQLYNSVRGYIPSFFRLTSLGAAPIDDTTSTITMTGVINNYQQYADVMLALWRIPGTISVSRSEYQLNNSYVPALTPEDQTGRRIKPGESNLPDDPLARLAAMQAAAKPDSFQNIGNFGGDPTLTRQAMPNATVVTIQVTLKKDLQTPDPRATLSSPLSTGTPATTTAGGSGAPL